uniref:DoxX family protein n=1 Tax=Pedobacter sp. TaxID=1411316 RepID=UPI003D7FF1B0
AAQLAVMWPWTAGQHQLVTISGIFDMLGALGLVLPALLNIKPQLTTYTALGVIVLMISAIIFHLSRGEASQIAINLFVAALALFIAWGRR